MMMKKTNPKKNHLFASGVGETNIAPNLVLRPPFKNVI